MKKIIFVTCLVCLILGWSNAAMATSLDELFGGATITVGDKLFSDWELLHEYSTSDLLPDYSLVEVIGLTDQPLNPGLQFDTAGQFSVFDTNFLEVEFAFDVTVLGPLLIKDNSLEMTDFSFSGDGGIITIWETVSDANGSFLADKSVQADNLLGNFILSDSAEFTPQNSIHVEKYIGLGGDDSGNVVNLNSFTQRFSQTPEPGTILLFGVGLLGFAGIIRRKK